MCWGESENLHLLVNDIPELRIDLGHHLPIGKKLSTCSLDLLAGITKRGCWMAIRGAEVHGGVNPPGSRRASTPREYKNRQKGKAECEWREWPGRGEPWG